MKKQLFMALAILLAATACSSNSEPAPGSDSSPSNTASAAPTAAAADDEPAELVFYSVSRDSEATFNERYGDAIRNKFPKYTIKYIQRVPESTDMQQLIASNQRIDLIFDSRNSFPGTMLGYDQQMDMTDLLKKHDVDLNRFEPTLVDYIKGLGDGEVYGLPLENSTNVIFYNKDIFDKFGVEYPRDGMSWKELQQLSGQLNMESDGAVYTGYFPAASYVILMNSFSLPMIDAKTLKSTYNNETWKTIIENEFLSMVNNPIARKAMDQYRKGNLLTLNQFIKDKVIAMFPGGQLVPIVYGEEMAKMNWDMVAMPTYEENPGVGNQSYPIYMGITKQAANKDAAMKVLKYLVSDEFQLQHSKKGNMTSLKNEDIRKAMGTESKFKDKNYKSFFYNKFAPIPDTPRVETGGVDPMNALINRVREVIAGKSDMNTALRATEEEVNKAIQTAAQK